MVSQANNGAASKWKRASELSSPAPTQTAPITYMVNGSQYILVTVAGAGVAAQFVALMLR